MLEHLVGLKIALVSVHGLHLSFRGSWVEGDVKESHWPEMLGEPLPGPSCQY